VDVVEDVVEKFRVFFDRSGEVARISVHVDYRSVITANGHTIVERDKWMDVFYPDGTARKVGTRCTSKVRPGSSSTMPGRLSSIPMVSRRYPRSASAVRGPDVLLRAAAVGPLVPTRPFLEESL
jgi:hypothetical protein